MRNCDKN